MKFRYFVVAINLTCAKPKHNNYFMVDGVGCFKFIWCFPIDFESKNSYTNRSTVQNTYILNSLSMIITTNVIIFRVYYISRSRYTSKELICWFIEMSMFTGTRYICLPANNRTVEDFLQRTATAAVVARTRAFMNTTTQRWWWPGSGPQRATTCFSITIVHT